MRQVRRGVFETNSSSAHNISFCTEQEFEAFKAGSLVYDFGLEGLVPVEEQNEDCSSYKQWKYEDGLETFEARYISPSGDKIVAFGRYGFDS